MRELGGGNQEEERALVAVTLVACQTERRTMGEEREQENRCLAAEGDGLNGVLAEYNMTDCLGVRSQVGIGEQSTAEQMSNLWLTL